MIGTKSAIAAVIISIAIYVNCRTAGAQTIPAHFNSHQFRSEYIFPVQDLHVHSSSIVEMPGGDLLACWFEGSGERKANDVLVRGARLTNGTSEWSKPFTLADTPGHPDCNPVLFMDTPSMNFMMKTAL